MENSIEKKTTKGQITVSRVYRANYQKSGTLTAEMKQEVTEVTLYPDKVIRDDLQGNIYDIAEYNQDKKEFKKSRIDVTWIDVPDTESVESVKARLSQYPNATLYRVISNHPIMSESTQKYIQNLIDTGQEAMAKKVKDRMANSQVLRYRETSPDDGHYKGELILDKFGKPQYKYCFLDETGTKEDIDLKTEDPQDFYTTVEIHMSLNNIVIGKEQGI